MEFQTHRWSIEEAVLEILRNANLEEMTEYKVRTLAADRLGIDLSPPDRKRFVRSVVESFLASHKEDPSDAAETPLEDQRQVEGLAADKEEEEVEAKEEEEDRRKRRAPKEYDDEGNLIVCRLSKKRRVTVHEFRGKTLVSIREFYEKEGKQLPTAKVIIMHWTCTKISTSTAVDDASLLNILLDKLKLCKGISYATIAAHADNSGRRKLAAMLVDHEPLSSKQVPLLLSIGEEDTALVKSTESGDTDLVFLVLFHIWQKKPSLDFFGTINARPLARDLFITYARFYKHEFLKDFFLSTGQLQDVAFLLLKESWDFEKNPMASKGSPLQGPQIRLIEQAQKLFSETKEHNFESKASEEHAKLLRLQHELEVSTKQAIFVGSSISDTIRTCIVLGNHRAALRVRTEFKVSDKRWYWLKSFALATVRDWDSLEKFSKEKRLPGGYKPFVEACIDADEKNEALKYIPKLTDPREKSEAYARIGMAKEAADAASQAKDTELFSRLKLTLAQNAAAASIFEGWRERLSFQGVY